MHRSIFIALAALAAGGAAAQERERPDPTDPRVAVPATPYRSAFEGYQAYAEEKVAPWRESNDAVKGPGGHAGPPAEEPKPAGKATPEPPAAGGYDGHGEHR